MSVIRRMLPTVLIAAGAAIGGFAMGEEVPLPFYAGAGAGMLLPGNGNSLDRAALLEMRAGKYVDEFVALELSVCASPNASSGQGHTDVWGVSAQALWHMAGWEFFDKLFGCERFDPFLSGGVRMYGATHHVFADDSHRTGVGPTIGTGAFYHLSDEWSLRFDLNATMSVDTPCGMMYSAVAGLQRDFGR